MTSHQPPSSAPIPFSPLNLLKIDKLRMFVMKHDIYLERSDLILITIIEYLNGVYCWYRGQFDALIIITATLFLLNRTLRNILHNIYSNQVNKKVNSKFHFVHEQQEETKNNSGSEHKSYLIHRNTFLTKYG